MPSETDTQSVCVACLARGCGSANVISAPYPRTASILTRGASEGMTMCADRPAIRAARDSAYAKQHAHMPQ